MGPRYALGDALICVEVTVSGTGVVASDTSDKPFTIVTLDSADIASAAPSPCESEYTLKEGDTVSGIAETFGVTVSDLLRANGLTEENAQSFVPGDQIIIPACD